MTEEEEEEQDQKNADLVADVGKESLFFGCFAFLPVAAFLVVPIFLIG